MRTNIAAGDCLSYILSAKYPKEEFVPFREAMIEGPNSYEPFSDEFLAERADFHGCSLKEYKKYMASFLQVLDRLPKYREIVLWFGEEPFCKKNVEVVIGTLKQRGFLGPITLNTVIEETGEVVLTERVQ